MNQEEIIARIASTIRKVLDNPNLEICAESSAEEMEGWDSVTHLQLVSELENEYDVKFTLREMMSWESVGELAETLTNKLQDA